MRGVFDGLFEKKARFSGSLLIQCFGPGITEELLVFRGAHTDAGVVCLIAHSDPSRHSPPEKQAG